MRDVVFDLHIETFVALTIFAYCRLAHLTAPEILTLFGAKYQVCLKSVHLSGGRRFDSGAKSLFIYAKRINCLPKLGKVRNFRCTQKAYTNEKRASDISLTRQNVRYQRF